MKPQKPELRRDYIQEKYVLIAPQRKKRPHDIIVPERVKLKRGHCPFCTPLIDDQLAVLTIKDPTKKHPWLIKVLLNKYPAVSVDNPKAFGVQEVIVESSEHTPEITDFPISHIAKILEVYAIRTKEMIKKVPELEYIIIFKNQGGRAGASLIHSHSQIFATSFIPPHLVDKSIRVFEYYLKYGSCVYCDVIEKERKAKERLVWEDKNIIAFCPYAPMYNYEVWIMPKRHIDNITQMNQKERISFAKILRYVLKKVDELGLPYNYYFHEIVNDKHQHLYMKITPRGSVWAGVEIGSGVVINPISPEESAEYYRKGIDF